MNTNHDQTCRICGALAGISGPVPVEQSLSANSAERAESFAIAAADFSDEAEASAEAADESSAACDRAAMRVRDHANRAEVAAIRAETAAAAVRFEGGCRAVLDALHEKLHLVPGVGVQSKVDFLLAQWILNRLRSNQLVDCDPPLPEPQ